MLIVHNVIQNYQIQNISYECLTTSKNYIVNTANKILKSDSLIKALIGIGIIFSLAYKLEAHVLPDTTTATTVLELDDVITVPIYLINRPPIICGLSQALCREFDDY